MHAIAIVLFILLVALWLHDLVVRTARDAARKEFVRKEIEKLERDAAHAKVEKPDREQAAPPVPHWNRYSFNKGEKAPGPSFLG